MLYPACLLLALGSRIATMAQECADTTTCDPSCMEGSVPACNRQIDVDCDGINDDVDPENCVDGTYAIDDADFGGCLIIKASWSLTTSGTLTAHQIYVDVGGLFDTDGTEVLVSGDVCIYGPWSANGQAAIDDLVFIARGS